MPSFEEKKAYAAQEETFFDDGREEELVDFVTSQPKHRGSPQGVLAAIDEFGRTRKYLMNVGEDKGSIVVELIRETRPRTMIELGGYCGYSTILFADAVRAAGGEKYYSLERNVNFAKNIKALIEFAGLTDIVEVVLGPSDDGIKNLHKTGKVNHIDLMFLDHYKPAYTTDLKLCESLGLISKGTVLAADNVITPGNPPYLKYVRSSVEEKRAALTQESKQDTENFPGQSATQYGKVETLGTDAKGNPHLVYESKLVESFEPTGVPDGIEITRCVEEDFLVSFFAGAAKEIEHKRQCISSSSTFQPRVILVTGVGMSKGLSIARAFYREGHHVIGADFEPFGIPVCGRFSSTLRKFYRISKPTSGPAESRGYAEGLLDIVNRESVDLWVSCSGVASAVQDGEAAEIIENESKCRAIQFGAQTTKTLDEKHLFIKQTRKFGLNVPETHLITSVEDALRVLHPSEKGMERKQYIMKSVGLDDTTRADMTLLPQASSDDTRSYLARLNPSVSRLFVLQQFISGPEYCTHSVIIRGRVMVFAACRSAELLMHYEAVSPRSDLSRALQKYSEIYAAKMGCVTGHFSIDFMLDERSTELDLMSRLYPIECNPRAHTAVVLFEQESGRMVDAYLSALEVDGMDGIDIQPVVTPSTTKGYYWIGHDLVTCVLLPLLSTMAMKGSISSLTEKRKVFLHHLMFWKDGTYLLWDPLPFWWLYYVELIEFGMDWEQK
ncbi:O-methyltransferase [Hyphodiscus hymeniophilus]|uniref:catechol O-methyltransferase n=1 Tax=Hyphodiscus hymeniophilus TaxID=353542 RepID=A0A9P6SPF3_9HELO|nr:O-methyltransferase [Hyphodiscus hymeniophilus]